MQKLANIRDLADDGQVKSEWKNFDDMAFEPAARHEAELHAVKMEGWFQCSVIQGSGVKGKPGDYIIRKPDGYYFLPGVEFERQYEILKPIEKPEPEPEPEPAKPKKEKPKKEKKNDDPPAP